MLLSTRGGRGLKPQRSSYCATSRRSWPPNATAQGETLSAHSCAGSGALLPVSTSIRLRGTSSYTAFLLPSPGLSAWRAQECGLCVFWDARSTSLVSPIALSGLYWTCGAGGASGGSGRSLGPGGLPLSPRVFLPDTLANYNIYILFNPVAEVLLLVVPLR